MKLGDTPNIQDEPPLSEEERVALEKSAAERDVILSKKYAWKKK